MIVEVEQISTMLGSTLSMLNSHGIFVKLAVYPAWLFFFSLPLYFTQGRLKEMLAFPFGAAIYVLQAVTMREWYVFRLFISLLYVSLFLLYLFVHDIFIGVMLVISFVERYCTNYYYSDLEQFYVHVKDDLEDGISFEKAISKPSTSDAYLALTNLRFRQIIPQELYLKALLSIDIDNTNGFLVSEEVYREICLYLPDYNSNEFFDTIYLVSFMLVVIAHPYLFFLGLGFYNKYTYFISTITVFIVLLNDGEVCFLISFLVCGVVYLFQMNIYTKLPFMREKAASLGFEDVSYKHVRYSRLLLYSTIFFMVLLVDASTFIYKNYHR